MILLCLTIYYDNMPVETEFNPYAAKVVNFYIEKTKRGGVYYQEAELDNGMVMVMNAFSANINGEKIRLIDYISCGDSVVRQQWNTIIVFREGHETQFFYHDPNDFE